MTILESVLRVWAFLLAVHCIVFSVLFSARIEVNGVTSMAKHKTQYSEFYGKG